MTKNDKQIQTISEACVALCLVVTQWGGRTCLKEEDLGEDLNLPPDTVASLGSKKICPPKTLTIFNTLKARAERLLGKLGVNNVLGSKTYIVPESRLDEALEGLAEIEKDFNVALREFEKGYNVAIQQWLNENAEWRGLIEGSLLPVEDVIGKISFSYHGYAFGEASDSALQGTLKARLAGLTGRLFREVAQVAKETYARSFEDKEKVTQASLNPLVVLRDKLKGFAAMQPKVVPIVKDINRVLDAAPDNGLPIDGMALFGLQGMLLLLKDARSAMEYAEQRVAHPNDDLFGQWQASNGLTQEKADAMSQAAARLAEERKLATNARRAAARRKARQKKKREERKALAAEQQASLLTEETPEVEETAPDQSEQAPVEPAVEASVETSAEPTNEAPVDEPAVSEPHGLLNFDDYDPDVDEAEESLLNFDADGGGLGDDDDYNVLNFDDMTFITEPMEGTGLSFEVDGEGNALVNMGFGNGFVDLSSSAFPIELTDEASETEASASVKSVEAPVKPVVMKPSEAAPTTPAKKSKGDKPLTLLDFANNEVSVENIGSKDLGELVDGLPPTCSLGSTELDGKVTINNDAGPCLNGFVDSSMTDLLSELSDMQPWLKEL